MKGGIIHRSSWFSEIVSGFLAPFPWALVAAECIGAQALVEETIHLKADRKQRKGGTMDWTGPSQSSVQ